jgi:hypothetical protein
MTFRIAEYYSKTDRIYSSVAFSFLYIMPGFPRTKELSGTSKLTNEFGAINTLDPILIFPNQMMKETYIFSYLAQSQEQ